jgi:PsbP
VKVTLVAFLLAAALVASAGCGGGGSGDGDKTYEGDAFSFTYPQEWDEREGEARFTRPGQQATSVYFGPAEGANVLGLDVGRVGVSITEANVDEISDQFAAELDQTFRQAQGGITKGPTRLTVGGLPALRFEGSSLNPDDVRVRSQVTAVFNGVTQYFLNCQFTPEGAEEMQRGCDQVVESFQVE